MAGDSDTGAEGSVLTVMGAAEQLLAADKPEAEATGGTEGQQEQDDAKASDENEAADTEQGQGEDAGKTQDENEGEAESQDDSSEVEAPDTALVTVQNEDGTTRRVTVAELKKSPLLLADYTRKTQKAAEARKQAEAEAGEYKKAREQYAQRVEQVVKVLDEATPREPDWDRIKAERPDEYAGLHADWTRLQDMKARAKAEQERLAAETRREREVEFVARVAEEGKLLIAAVPELADPEKAPSHKALMYAAAEKIGFTRQEVDTEADHRLLVMLDKAARWDALQQEKAKLATQAKKADAAGVKDIKTIAPGAAKRPASANEKQRGELVKQARATGRVADAAAAIAALDKT